MRDKRSWLLATLDERRGEWVSGEGLAATLGVTRAAVWKLLTQLQEEGVPIEAQRRLGYRLPLEADLLDAEAIAAARRSSTPALAIEVHEALDSTNRLAAERARQGAPEGTVIVAAEQTAGRGRFGRSFHSPRGSGLYLSVVLRPRLAYEDALLITTTAAVAVAEAIETLYPEGPAPRIKWVNDILLGGKKLAGILTEASLDMESGQIAAIVLGIGLNVYPPAGGFPEELREIATALRPAPEAQLRSRLAAAILDAFFAEGATRPSPHRTGARRSSMPTARAARCRATPSTSCAPTGRDAPPPPSPSTPTANCACATTTAPRRPSAPARSTYASPRRSSIMARELSAAATPQRRRLATRQLVLVALFTALIIVGAFVRIPIPVVPFTLQFLFTLLAGLLLGSRLGTIAVLSYIALGLVGIPVFTEGGGIAYVLKPSFGYIIGFAVGAWVTGRIVEAARTAQPSLRRLLVASLANIAIVYAFGLPYFYAISHLWLGSRIAAGALLFHGFLVVVPGDLLLCVVGALVARRILPMMGRFGLGPAR